MIRKKRINRQDATLKNTRKLRDELQRLKSSLMGEIKLLDNRIRKVEIILNRAERDYLNSLR